LGRIVFVALVGVLGTGILVSLGVWQVQRLAWKEALLDEIEAQIAAPPIALPEVVSQGEHNRLPVTGEGVIAPERLRILVSQKVFGAGYRVISPFQLGSRRVLLDRGFIPVANDIPTPPQSPVTVTGNLHWPDEIDGFTPEPDLNADIWFARDVPAMAAALGTEPVLVVARSLSQTEPGLAPLPVDTTGIPNDHFQYAVTWFSLAGIWVAMTGYFLYRQRRRGSDV